MTSPTLTLHINHEADGPTLERLGQLDSQRPLSGDVLVAEADGRPVAAVSLADGRVTADPFAETATAVALLRTRAAQLGRPSAGTAHHRLPRLRAA